MKKIVMILCIFCFSVAFGAGEFDQINNTVTSMSNAAKTTVGTGLQWFIGVLPLMMFVAIGFGGYSVSKRKAEQDQNTTRIAVVTGIGSVVGFLLGLGIVAILGTALLGDGMKGINVMRQFWATTLGV